MPELRISHFVGHSARTVFLWATFTEQRMPELRLGYCILDIQLLIAAKKMPELGMKSFL